MQGEEAWKRLCISAKDPQLVNKPDATGFLPLQWAALNNRVSVATLLLAGYNTSTHPSRS